ncbi:MULTISPECIES: DUF1822 family protein [Planktothricoides]|uniref:DUF1822 family protein n=1 Tax=Planktothricoides raciborskii FACHB-1370 TaxID=2949576 RepID=A0ABR8EAT4_9CYAN|nr:MULTISPECIES: DUF1822 family protein [Planktothricoides]KOR37819.1 hypothetical protein AM228_04995 [Planktothricoides sp. SR001]MBD2543590.1 DUF1822 family protein [Planktothricoides raciborskii FACHB-1370]MBD2581280.1 DUF1822 family protein [Planktothricoides raciborskii FACHB-1261]
MAVSLIASEEGLNIVDGARRIKNLNKYSLSWAQSAVVGQAALKKFWRRIPIVHENFVSICQAVGVNWEDVCEKNLTQSLKVEKNWILTEGWLVEVKAMIEKEEEALMQQLFSLLDQFSGNVLVNKQRINSGYDRSWQSVDSLLNPKQSRSRITDATPAAGQVELAKQVDFGDGNSVILVVQQTPTSDEEVEVIIEIYPVNDDLYLPSGLQVLILDEAEAVVPELSLEIKSFADSIKVPFSVGLYELFYVQLTLGNTKITESF